MGPFEPVNSPKYNQASAGLTDIIYLVPRHLQDLHLQ